MQNTEIRIQEHYQGRLYLGWKKVRDRYALIKDKYKDKRHPNPQWRHRTKGEKEAAGKQERPRSHRRDDGYDRRRDDRDRRDDYRRDGYDRPRSRDDDRRSRDDDRRRRRSRSRSRGRSRRGYDDDDPRSRYDSRSRYYR